MIALLKKSCLFLFVLSIAFLGACNSKKDYSCSVSAGTVVTNSDGTQYTATSTETKTCSDCTTKEVQKLKDQGYSCN